MTGTGSEQYWLASKPADVNTKRLAAYLDAGEWKSPTPQSHKQRLEAMQPGDRIALKTIARKKTGLPFFNSDQPASVMTIHATGTVVGSDPAAGVINIKWDPPVPPRDWYFFTYVPTLVPIDASREPMGRQLVAFLFEGAQQELAPFLADPYWSSRYVAQPQFTWIPFYEEFATRLLDFQKDRTALVTMLLKAAESQPHLHYLTNTQFIDGPEGTRDIDPFTVLAAFNRGLTYENRRSVAAVLGDALGVDAALPEDVDGVPLVNNIKTWYVTYAADQETSDIPVLWRVFAAALSLSAADTPENRREFCSAYDAALAVKGVQWNLSQGLYWARPNDYVTLDGHSRRYIRQHYRLDEATDGAAYLELRDTLRDRFSKGGTSITSFPLLSYAAWLRGTQRQPGHDMNGFATWAGRMAESVDLDDVEHDYKRATADLLRQAREQAASGDSRWQATFHEGLKSTNTLNFRFIDDVHKAIEATPVEMLAALNLVWDTPTPTSLDTFQNTMRGLLGSITPGNATGLGAWLLMSVDVEASAPYSPTRTETWYKLTGFEGPGSSASATVRYSTMLRFLDELTTELRNELGVELSRLETQGAAWATTEHAIPSDWSQEDQQALRTWRSSAQGAQRAWLVRPKNVSARDWIDNDYVSLPATNLGDVPPGASEKTVKNAVDVGYQHVDYSQRKALTAEYYSFLSLMKVGDLVTAQSETALHIGVIESEPDYAGEADDRLHRAVSWQSTVSIDDLPASVAGLLDLQGSVVDITQGLEALTGLLDNGSKGKPKATPRPPSELRLPQVSDDLASGLFMDRELLQEILDLLASRRQVVLHGPPGTGKTFLALALARHVVGPDDRSRVQLVQFHPSYAYEDFFEGFRPIETDSGQATFELTPGPLRRIAKDAKENPDNPYVLVIDELNRANLAKVFGELYFLLEYREESIRLQYNPTEAFQLPPNLFFIGTMNTADRSIALLDSAMRRRFSFIELHPDEQPVRDVLARWLKAQGASDERARLLTTLNAAIEEQDRDLRIGPSYLMRPEASTKEGLGRIWKYDIVPLLEEHYYGRLTRQQIHQKFGLDAIRSGSTQQPGRFDDDERELSGFGPVDQVDVERLDDTDKLFDEGPGSAR